MSPEITSILKVIKKEVWRHRRLTIFLYLLCSTVFLIAAWNWPKIYTSSSTVLVDRQNILRPLMAGMAETTQVENRSSMANKIIFSKKSLARILESETWQNEYSGLEKARAIELLGQRLSGSTNITNMGENLIEISFSSSDPLKAYQTAQLMTDLFIEESLAKKQNESQAAYNFIDNQVKTYHQKLKDSEEAIKAFRSKNIDASENAKENASQRLIELKRELESVELDLSSTESSLSNYRKQLAGETSFQDKASLAREQQLNERITALENRLSDLKLSYHETYPDVVQVKGQIEDLKRQVINEASLREQKSNRPVNQAPTGETAQVIQSQIIATENTIASLKTRQQQIKNLINNEKMTLERISNVEAEIAELTRDYEVNQEMYQSLLNQRENARISMNIDLENQGLTLKIQEPAAIPVSPRGIGFSHIVLAGLILSFAIPIALIYGLTLLDQKVRTEPDIQEHFDIPILANVQMLESPKDIRASFVRTMSFAASVILVWSVYGLAIIIKMQG